MPILMYSYKELLALFKLVLYATILVLTFLLFLDADLERSAGAGLSNASSEIEPALRKNATYVAPDVRMPRTASIKSSVYDDFNADFHDPLPNQKDDGQADEKSSSSPKGVDGLRWNKGNLAINEVQVTLPISRVLDGPTTRPGTFLDLYDADGSDLALSRAYIGAFYGLKATCPDKKDYLACHIDDEEHELFKQRLKELERRFDEFIQGYLAGLDPEDIAIHSWLGILPLVDNRPLQAVSDFESVNSLRPESLAPGKPVARYLLYDLKPRESYELALYTIIWTTWCLHYQQKRIKNTIAFYRTHILAMPTRAARLSYFCVSFCTRKLATFPLWLFNFVLVSLVITPVSHFTRFCRACYDGIYSSSAGLKPKSYGAVLSSLGDSPEFGALLAIVFAYDLLTLLAEWMDSQPDILAFPLSDATSLINAFIFSGFQYIFRTIPTIPAREDFEVTLVESEEEQESPLDDLVVATTILEASLEAVPARIAFVTRLAIKDSILREDLEIFRDDKEGDDTPGPWTYDPDDWVNDPPEEFESETKPKLNMSIPEPCTIAFRPFWTVTGHFALGVLVCHDFPLDDPRYEDAIWYDPNFSKRNYKIKMDQYDLDYESSFLEYFEVTLWPNTVVWDLFVAWGQDQGAMRDVRLLRPAWGSMAWGWTEGWEPFYMGPPKTEEEEPTKPEFRFRPPQERFDLWATPSEVVEEGEEGEKGEEIEEDDFEEV